MRSRTRSFPLELALEEARSDGLALARRAAVLVDCSLPDEEPRRPGVLQSFFRSVIKSNEASGEPRHLLKADESMML